MDLGRCPSTQGYRAGQPCQADSNLSSDLGGRGSRTLMAGEPLDCLKDSVQYPLTTRSKLCPSSAILCARSNERPLVFVIKIGTIPIWERASKFFFAFVGDADLGEAVTQGVAGQAQQARGLALVAIGTAQGFLHHFIFPFFQRHPFGKKSAGAIRVFCGTYI